MIQFIPLMSITYECRKGLVMPTFSVKLYQIRLRQDYLGQECVNIFYYKDDETGPAIGLSAVAGEFNTTVMRDLEDIQVDSLVGIDLRVRVLGGGVEHVDDISTQFGTRDGPAGASFNAWGYKLVRTNIDIRNGSKRFAGVSENDTAGNLPEAAMLSILGTLATTLAAPLVLTNTAELTPVIYRQNSFTDPDWFGSVVADCTFRKLTSQVSRKFDVD